MVADVVIRADGLGKRYRIGAAHPNRSLRETLSQAIPSLVRRRRRRPRDTVWALQDVSLEITEGEVLGIIGRNGAGKSTLLRILSRITEPTVGRVEIRGRVGSLLEVGTGFHPELTGRENISLNGAILGMSRTEIARKFDEIVDFAGVEQFIDTPVKRYSTGMYLRLAFSVAAHLEPEILLVDEVLAVGDAEFQKKCLGRMSAVSREGRTVLFVSHNMVSVQQLCDTTAVLDGGRLAYLGDTASAISYYLSGLEAASTNGLANRRDRRGSGWLRVVRVEICDSDEIQVSRVISGQDVRVRLHYLADRRTTRASVNIAFNVCNRQGLVLCNLNSVDTGSSELDVHARGYFECTWPRFCLRSGDYPCTIFCEIDGEIVDWVQSAFVLRVEDGNFFGTGKLVGREQGDVLVSHFWDSHEEPA